MPPFWFTDERVPVKDKVILLVEDNASDESLIMRAIRKNQLADEVIVARDGAEALDYLFCRGQYAERDPGRLPHVVFLDLKLPKIDGLEVLRHVRAEERTRLVPVVILTSSAEEQDIVGSYRLGANSFVRKPIRFEEFADAVRQLGLYWLLLNQPPDR